MGVRATLPLEPTEACGLHTSCRGLRAGRQSTMKSPQLSAQENWPKRCGNRTRPCQPIRTPGGGRGGGSRAERVGQEEVFSRVLAAFPAPLSCSSEWWGAKVKSAESPLEAGPSSWLPPAFCSASQVLLLQSPERSLCWSSQMKPSLTGPAS